MEDFFTALKRWNDFSGRARRREYWFFYLFYCLFIGIAFLLDTLAGANGVLYLILCLLMIIPCISVSVRRMHDLGKSGWWILISLIPLIGGIWFFVLTLMEGQPTANRYGPDPKEAIHQFKG